MASGGDGPRLPDTEDPYVLLGVEADVDERELKRVYARMIRQYRPDGAPKEFQRVHTAFERIKAQLGTDARVNLEPTRTALEEPAAPEPGAAEIASAQQREVAAKLDAAAAAAAPGERARLVDALLASSLPLEMILDEEARREVVLAHPTLSWSQLSRTSAPLFAVFGVWELAWAKAFTSDPKRAVALLDDPRLRLDAAEYPELAHECLRRLAALIWKDVDTKRVIESFRTEIPAHPFLDSWFDRIALAREAASAQRGPREHVLWDRLEPLLLVATLGTRDERARTARELLDALAADLPKTLLWLEEANRDYDFGALCELFYDVMPLQRISLEALAKPDFDRVTRVLYDIGYQPRKWQVRGSVAAAGAAAGLVVGAVPAVLALGAAGIYGLATESARYRNTVRPLLAKALLELAVTSGVLARWVRINGGLAGRLSRFSPALDNDTALYLLSMIVCYATEVGGLDEPTDDDAVSSDEAD